MAKYEGEQSVLDAGLGEFAELGFSLEEESDHILELYFKDKCIARYIQEQLTIPILREGCRNYLNSIMKEA